MYSWSTIKPWWYILFVLTINQYCYLLLWHETCSPMYRKESGTQWRVNQHQRLFFPDSKVWSDLSGINMVASGRIVNTQSVLRHLYAVWTVLFYHINCLFLCVHAIVSHQTRAVRVCDNADKRQYPVQCDLITVKNIPHSVTVCTSVLCVPVYCFWTWIHILCHTINCV